MISANPEKIPAESLDLLRRFYVRADCPALPGEGETLNPGRVGQSILFPRMLRLNLEGRATQPWAA